MGNTRSFVKLGVIILISGFSTYCKKDTSIAAIFARGTSRSHLNPTAEVSTQAHRDGKPLSRMKLAYARFKDGKYLRAKSNSDEGRK